MYELTPPAVYAHESVVANPVYKARLERVVSALTEPIEPIVYKDDDIVKLLKEDRIFAKRRAMGTLDEIQDPILLFNTFRFDGRRAEQEERLKQQGYERPNRALLGYGAFAWAPYNLAADSARNDKVCRPCWRVHFQNGCVHRCHYCGAGGLLITMVNVEDYIENFARLIEAHPWQETYLLEDDADIPCLEPELGCLGEIIEFFGTLKDRYLVIHTKSWNFDWALDLKHNGNTIIVWSLSAPTQSTIFEPKTGTTEQRIEAARKCQEAGYTIRYKFKPIIPVRNWREETTETVRMIFERSNPDLISLCTFMWLDVDQMKSRLDTSLLDPECLAAAEQAVARMADSRARPFPPETRAMLYEHHIREIRRHSPDIPLSVSTETLDMWKRLEGTIGSTVGDYVCGCGANSTPWRQRLTHNPYDCLSQGPFGGFEKM